MNLPPKGVPLRSEQLSFLQGLIHRRFIEPAMVDKVRALSDRSTELDDLRDRLVPFYHRILGSESVDIPDLPAGPFMGYLEGKYGPIYGLGSG